MTFAAEDRVAGEAELQVRRRFEADFLAEHVRRGRKLVRVKRAKEVGKFKRPQNLRK